MLSVEQHLVFEKILNLILLNNSNSSSDRCQKNCIFLEEKAGCGKTFLVNCIVDQLRDQSLLVLICGSTALSVTLYQRGRTAHSLFGISIDQVSFMCLLIALFEY
jgi:hypothetical protein